MLKCWETDVEARLCFNDVVEELGEATGKYYGPGDEALA